MSDDVREQNRKSWNAATRAHNSHKADQAGFLRGGGTTLFPEELVLLGDLQGKRLVHLQCNAGQDSLSLAARGADVTVHQNGEPLSGRTSGIGPTGALRITTPSGTREVHAGDVTLAGPPGGMTDVPGR